jgi:hypothetical protein
VAFALPTLHVVTVYKALGLLFRDLIVWAQKLDRPKKVVVCPDKVRKPAIQLDKQPAIIVREPDATMQRTSQDIQLTSKHRVLGFKPQLRLDGNARTVSTKQSSPIIPPGTFPLGALSSMMMSSLVPMARASLLSSLRRAEARHRRSDELARCHSIFHDTFKF